MNIKRTIITTLVALALVAVVAPVVASATTVSDLMAQIAQLQAQLQGLSGSSTSTSTTTGSTPAACVGVTFTRNLTVGSIGSDVKCLQVILNMNSSTQVSATGAGAPGYETTYFGSRTLAAVKIYQANNGFSPAAQVGPLTRAKLNAWLGGTSSTTTTTTTTTGGLVPGCTSTVGYSQTTGASCATGVVAVNNGPVSAQMATDNPAAGAIISNQATADLLHINFTGSGTVTSVTLQRTGISDQNTLANVYLFDGNQRITDGYSFNVNGTLTMNGLSIAVNGSHEISVRADVESGATTTSSSVAIALTGLNGGSANVQGNTFTIVTGSAASAYLSANTTCVNSGTPSLNSCTGGLVTSVNAGTSQYDFWSAPLQVNTRAVLLKTANFRMIGSAPTNAISNINLFVDGVNTGKVATVGVINGTSYAMFDLTSAPITLTTGSHTLDVRADITSGTSRTLQLSLQQASDLTITDPQVGVNIATLGAAGATFSANPGIYVTIAAGSSTVMVDPTFTSQTNISAGATNAVIGRFTLQGYGENVKVSDLFVSPAVLNGVATTGCTTDATTGLATGTSVCGLNNVTLYFNGSQIGSQKNYTETHTPTANNTGMTNATTGAWGTGLDFSLGSQMVIPAGQTSTIEVRADLQTAGNYAYTSGSVRVALVAETNNATGQSSQTSVGIPTGAVATSGLTISSSTVAAGTNSQLLASSVSPNTASQKIGSYIIQNQSTSESVRLTSLNVGLLSQSGTNGVVAPTSLTQGQLTGGTAIPLTNYSALTLKFSDSTPSPTPIQPNAANNFSINDTLAPNASVTVDVYANIGGTTGYVQTTLTVQSIGTVDNISATYPTSVSDPSALAGQIMTIGAGSLTAPTAALTSSSQTTPQQFIVPQGQTTPASQATYEFISTGGASAITEMDFAVNSGAVTQICVGSNCAQPFNVGGVYTAKVTGLNLNVPTGSGLDQVVTVAYGPVGVSGNVPNTAATLTLSTVKWTSGGAAQADRTPNAVAPTVYLVNSQPTITVGGSATGLTGTGTVQKIGDVTIKADSHGSIKLDKMTFNVGVSGFDSNSATVGATSLFLSAGSSSSNSLNSTIPCTGNFSGTSGTITCLASGVTAARYANDYSIGLGASQEFTLWASVTGGYSTNTANPTITTSLKQDTSSTTYSNGYFIWDDTSMSGLVNGATALTNYGDAASGTGLTSYNIYSFPTSGNYSATNH